MKVGTGYNQWHKYIYFNNCNIGMNLGPVLYLVIHPPTVPLLELNPSFLLWCPFFDLIYRAL